MEYMDKMISVVIPVYQAKDYLKQCVDSILNQTYKNTEIILVDDGSKDGSSALCDSYCQKYSNVFCIHQDNKGVSAARNTGINNAKGEYILFIDSDDYIETDYLETALSAFENKNVDMYLCGYQNVRNNGRRKEKEYYPMITEGEWNHDDLSNNIMRLFRSTTLHAIGTKIYKKDIIEQYKIRFQEEWKYFEDIYFCLSYLFHCDTIYVQNKIMYYYRRDVFNSLSKQKYKYNYVSIYKVFHLLYGLMDIKRTNKKDKAFFSKRYLEYINSCINSKVLTEKYYTINIHNLYKTLSQDKLYRNTAAYMGKMERFEFLCINNGFFLAAYLIRNFVLNDFPKDRFEILDSFWKCVTQKATYT